MAASRTAVADTTEDGAFKRQPSVFRERVSVEHEVFKPAAGRYVLYISLACPWANRCLAALRLKGLEDAIAVSVTHPVWARTRPGVDDHAGWQFCKPDDPPVTNPAGCGSFPCDGCVPDPVHNARFVRDIYERAGADAPGVRFTVPILFDTLTNRIVCNESEIIVRTLNSDFNSFAKNAALDLYPAALREAIDEVNVWVYSDINNGVYRCGFATTQAAYETAFHALYAALERVEAILAKQRYLVGAQFTEADLRLFMTLIRFDEVYAVYFKTNGRLLREMPNIFNYIKDFFSMPDIRRSINMAHIKRRYYASHPSLNVHAIVPVGLAVDYDAPHDRDRF